jgi:RecB family exonuclease
MIESIREHLTENRTRAKTVLCASGAAGHLLLRAILAREPGVINLHCRTVADFVGRSLGFWLIENEVKVLKPGHGILLLQELIDPGSSMATMQAMPGFQEALWNAILDLRLERIAPETLSAATLGDEVKACELAALLKAYDAALKQHHLIDYPGLLRRGIFERRLENGPDLIFLPGSLPLRPLESEFLEQAGDRLIRLPFDVPNDTLLPGSWRIEDRRPAFDGRDRAILPPAATVQLFTAVDPTAEIREVLRRILASGAPFEAFMVVTPQPAEYANLCAALFETAGVPLALGTARPPEEFRPGRLALSLCDWAMNGFAVEELIAMLNQGDLRLFPARGGTKPGRPRPPGSSRIISVLRQSHARGGRDGYERPLHAVAASARERGNPLTALQCRRLARRLKTLFAGFPESAPPGELAMTFRDTLARFTRVTGPADLKRLSSLRARLAEYRSLTKPVLPLAEGMRWLTRIVRQAAAQESFRPDGRVLLTTPEAAACAERPVVFFPGLTHDAVPGKPSPDPIVADVFRRRLPPLKTAAETRLESLGSLAVCWASLGWAREIILSLPLVDAGGRALSPAAPFLQALAAQLPLGAEFAGVLNTELLPLIGPLVGGGPRGAEALDLREWLWRCGTAGMPPAVLRAVGETEFPGFKKFPERQQARATGRAPVVSGLPAWDPAAWTRFDRPDHAVSASGVETYAGCRYAVFLGQVLGCMPAEMLDTLPLAADGWLDGMQRGSLLHEIYESFSKQVGWPVTAAHAPLMDRIVEEITTRYHALVPPPTPSVFRREKENIRRDARYFLDLESRRADLPGRPVGFELSFGMPKRPCAESGCVAHEPAPEPLPAPEPAPAPGNAHEFPEPVPFLLPNGRTLYLKGRLDRLDATPAGLEVWDYKTGNSEKFLPGGKQHPQGLLQIALYKYAVNRLPLAKDHAGGVGTAGLYFPTRNGRGKRLSLDTADDIGILNQRLVDLVDFLETGAFPAAAFCEDCNARHLCPFAPLLAVTVTAPEGSAAEPGKETDA